MWWRAWVGGALTTRGWGWGRGDARRDPATASNQSVSAPAGTGLELAVKSAYFRASKAARNASAGSSMVICGAHIQGSTLITLPVKADGTDIIPLPSQSNKIELPDHSSQKSIQQTFVSINAYIDSNHIELVYCKAVQAVGKYSAGPAAIKLEALLQCVIQCEVRLVDPRSIAIKDKKGLILYPNTGLYAYQRGAYAAVSVGVTS